MTSTLPQPVHLRIAVVTETYPPEVNGVAMTMGRLVQGLGRLGHTVQLIRPRQSAQDQPTQSDGLEEVLVRSVAVPRFADLRVGWPAATRLGALWRDKRPDIVHVVTEGPLGASAVTAARRAGIPVTSSYHTHFDSYSDHYRLGLLGRWVQAWLRRLHNRTRVTLAPTRALCRQLSLQGYHQVAILARGVDTSLFRPHRRSERLRAEWGLAADDLAVLYVGRLAAEKNLDTVVAAFKALRGQRPGARLVLVGDGPLRESLRRSCPEAIFCGARHGVDLAEHYASGDLFLFASMTETYGNVVPEALASGLAVVAYDRAAAAELMQPGVNGLRVPPGDTAEFIQRACFLSSHPEAMRRMRQAAPASVSHLDWQQVQADFAQTLMDVALAAQLEALRPGHALRPKASQTNA